MKTQKIELTVRLFGLASMFLLLGVGGTSQAETPQKADFYQSVIVQYKGRLTVEQKSQLAKGGYVYRNLPFISAVAVKVPARRVNFLTNLPYVTNVSNDTSVQKSDEFVVEGSLADDAATNFGVTGKDVGIAVVDSGVKKYHLDLLGRVKQSVNFVTSLDPLDNTTEDPCGHGTHVAGIVAGNGTASSFSSAYRTFKGVAPAANIISVRVLNRFGGGWVSDTLAGLQWITTNKDTYNIRVVNLSLGHPVGESYKTDPLTKAVDSLWNAGLVVVCAAGNDGRQNLIALPGFDNEGYGTAYGSIQSPGNSPSVITVGAMKQAPGTNYTTYNRSNDRIATYSGRGPTRLDYVLKPDIVAPGNRIISLNSQSYAWGTGTLLSYLQGNFGNTNVVPYGAYLTLTDTSKISASASFAYFQLSGTSMASPVVAGAAALLLEKDPTLTPNQVKMRLMLTADKWGSDVNSYGAGYVNIPAALSSKASVSSSAKSPVLKRNSDGTVSVVKTGSIAAEVNDTRLIWGDRALWGNNTLTSSRALWGNFIWSDRALWGNTTNVADLSNKVIIGEN